MVGRTAGERAGERGGGCTEHGRSVPRLREAAGSSFPPPRARRGLSRKRRHLAKPARGGAGSRAAAGGSPGAGEGGGRQEELGPGPAGAAQSPRRARPASRR